MLRWLRWNVTTFSCKCTHRNLWANFVVCVWRSTACKYCARLRPASKSTSYIHLIRLVICARFSLLCRICRNSIDFQPFSQQYWMITSKYFIDILLFYWKHLHFLPWIRIARTDHNFVAIFQLDLPQITSQWCASNRFPSQWITGQIENPSIFTDKLLITANIVQFRLEIISNADKSVGRKKRQKSGRKLKGKRTVLTLFFYEIYKFTIQFHLNCRRVCPRLKEKVIWKCKQWRPNKRALN